MSSAVTENVVRYLPLGGHGEVGMNCAVLETPAGIILIDCGVNFPDADYLGYDTVIPDFSWLVEREERLLGLVLTHAHMDHIGAVSWLLRQVDLPVYGGSLALALVRSALQEAQIADSADLRLFRLGERFRLGDVEVEPIHVNHSVPQTTALAFHTPVGVFVHTADFKLDANAKHEAPADVERFRELGDAGVRVLLSDSTNVQRPGRSSSETEVAEGLRQAVRDAEGGAVIVPLFSTNLWRVQALVDAAEETGRTVIGLGYSLQRNLGIARELGLLRVKRDTTLAQADQLADLPHDKLLLLASGSQGEPRAAFARMCRNELRGFRFQRRDTVIYSARVIPGNEMGVYALWDQLARHGVRLVTGDDAPVHCSGHGYQDEHRELLQLLRPKLVIPVHGDYRFLATHAEVAREEGAEQVWVLDNGETLAISPDKARREERVSLTLQIVDGSHVVELGGTSMRERARLGRHGLVVAVVWQDPTTGDLAEPVHLLTHGLFDASRDADALGPKTLRALETAAEEAFYALEAQERRKRATVVEAVQKALRRALRRLTGLKPVLEVVLRS